MITIQGKGVSAGVALGPLYFYRRAAATLRRYEVEDREAEWLRFKAAQERPSNSWARWRRRPGRRPGTRPPCSSRPTR